MEEEAINFYFFIMDLLISITNMTVLHLDFGVNKLTQKQVN
jgi:hypothetical protein